LNAAHGLFSLNDFQHVRMRVIAATLRRAVPILDLPRTRNRPHFDPVERRE